MSKEAVVLAFDLSACAKLNLQSHVAKQLVRGKLLFSKRDEIALVTAGGAKTNNPLGSQGYENIDLICPHRIPDLEMLEEIDEIQAQSDGASVDAIDTLMVCLQVILDRVGKLKFTKKVYLMSLFEKPIEWIDQLADVVDRIRDMDVRVNFIILTGANELDESQKKNIEFIEKLSEALPDNVALFFENVALEIVNQFKKKIVRSVPKFRGYLEWHPKLKFRVKTLAKTAVQNMPSLKKISIPAQALESDAGVKMAKSYINRFLETPEERDDSDRVKAYKYGKAYVPFSQVDEKLLQYTCEPCLRILAFMDANQVPRHHFMNTVDLVVPEEDDTASLKIFSSLLTALEEANKVAIMRYVKRTNSDPIVVCASPYIDSDDQKILCLNHIPFDEDLREYLFSNFMSDDRRGVSDHQRSSVRNLINALDLTKIQANDAGETDTYVPESTFNPVLQRFYSAVEQRALVADSSVEVIDEPIREYLELHGHLLAHAEEELKCNFALYVL
jgi:ATP-dependent DNA helicase 2 subunit 2